MNTKHYLIISGIVGGIIGSLLTALLVSPVTAQKDKFDSIQCSKLEVVDANGVARVILSTNMVDGFGENITACVIGDEDRGRVAVYGKGKDFSSKGSASLGVNNRGGVVVAASKDKGALPRRLVRLSIEEQGGSVEVDGKDGESSVLLYIDENGGRIAAYGEDGKSAGLSMTEDGGFVGIKDKYGQVKILD